MQDQQAALHWVCRVHHDSSGFCYVNFTSATAIGCCGDDVLCCSLLIGRLPLQMLRMGLGCGLLGVQLSLALRDDVVCLRDVDEATLVPQRG